MGYRAPDGMPSTLMGYYIMNPGLPLAYSTRQYMSNSFNVGESWVRVY